MIKRWEIAIRMKRQFFNFRHFTGVIIIIMRTLESIFDPLGLEQKLFKLKLGGLVL